MKVDVISLMVGVALGIALVEVKNRVSKKEGFCNCGMAA